MMLWLLQGRSAIPRRILEDLPTGPAGSCRIKDVGVLFSISHGAGRLLSVCSIDSYSLWFVALAQMDLLRTILVWALRLTIVMAYSNLWWLHRAVNISINLMRVIIDLLAMLRLDSHIEDSIRLTHWLFWFFKLLAKMWLRSMFSSTFSLNRSRLYIHLNFLGGWNRLNWISLSSPTSVLDTMVSHLSSSTVVWDYDLTCCITEWIFNNRWT